ncbi:hypothetical protein [Bacillus manliponensis]|uniref:hypothetical protein n=1 Tax=Bacillus manliponensis TaxID=574376 RepID=UPI0035119B11
MCSSGQCLFLPLAMLQQMDEMSTFSILIYVAGKGPDRSYTSPVPLARLKKTFFRFLIK